jgi:hypothetical protein
MWAEATFALSMLEQWEKVVVCKCSLQDVLGLLLVFYSMCVVLMEVPIRRVHLLICHDVVPLWVIPVSANAPRLPWSEDDVLPSRRRVW